MAAINIEQHKATEGKTMKTGLLGLSALFVMLALLAPSAAHSATTTYCSVPPFVQINVEPNIMLFLDTSCDMSGPAYHYPVEDPTAPHPTYVAGRSYIGLFESNYYYTWNSTNKEWRIAAIQPVLPSPLPAGCYTDVTNAIGQATMPGATADASFKYKRCCGDYYCQDGAATPVHYFKGSFMNYILSSRYDVMMRILVGGYGPAIGGDQINRFETFAAIPCSATCTADTDCPAGQRCEIVHGKKQCSGGESEWEWVDPVTNCSFELERGSELEFEIEGSGHGTNVCTITGTSVKTIETTGVNPSMFVAVDRYSDGNAIPAGVNLKTSGLVQEYYDRAHWGFSTIRSSNASQVNVGSCISVTNPTSQSFVNAVTAPGNTPTALAKVDLATAYAGIIDYFKFNGAASYTGCTGATKDPFYNDTSPCRKNFVLTLGSAYSVGGTDYDTLFSCPSPGDCDSSVVGNNCSNHLARNSCYAYEKDLRDGTAGMGAVQPGKQNLYHFGVFTMGADYENTDGCTSTAPPGVDNPCRKINKVTFRDAANAGGGKYEGNQQFFEAPSPDLLEQAIKDAINAILRRVTSGTAASVLASGEGSGANLVQATYYPRRRFYDATISWVGGLQNLWYYVDPFFSTSNIRADGGDKILDLKTSLSSDWITQLYFDPVEQKAKARLYNDVNGDGQMGAELSPGSPVDFETMGNLWEAGKLLWARDPATRTIYTPLDTTQALTADANKFAAFASPGVNNVAALRPLLNTDASANTNVITQTTENNQLAANVINWVRGVDQSPYTYTGPLVAVSEAYRSRTVALNATSGTNVWKLGDIIDSTPRIASWVQLNQYDKAYGDTYYKDFVNDTYLTDLVAVPLTSTARYKNRGTVFVGANDGMLHAFKLGKLGLNWTSRTASQKATLKYCLSDPSKACAVNSDCTSSDCTLDTDIGTELWTFIPKNMLPYLKYIKETDYCHLYGIDLTTYLFDASINIDGSVVGQVSGCTDADNAVNSAEYWKCKKSAKSWKTILIGGMRYGGACRNNGVACNGGTDCVNTPVNGLGYSSYFALDVTDPSTPKFLWEFNDTQLGYATTGPAIIRIASRSVSGLVSVLDDPKTTNGRWFVVLGSGPTGPVETNEHQFMGRSDQNLRLFVLDLKTGSRIRTIDAGAAPLGITNAFAGSLLNAGHDSDIDYQDDAIYVGYTKRTATSPYTWTDGGILRVLTRANTLNGTDLTANGNTALNPNNWVASKVIDGIGPVTSSIVRLQNKNSGKLWLYSGTGRYFFKLSNAADDASGQRHIFGFKEPCFTAGAFKPVCADADQSNDPVTPAFSDICWFQVDLTSTAGYGSDVNNDSYCGWKINLDAPDTVYNAERVVTDPLSTSQGIVFFTTNKPYLSSCSTGGKTALWAVQYDTGAAPGTMLKGKALIQVSTGSIEQLDLSAAFTQRGNRKTVNIEGVPPMAQGLSIISSPPPVKKVLHMKER